MLVKTAFWDTSAIVPLLCEQANSLALEAVWRHYDGAVVWWGTHVEVHSALCRMRDEGVMTVNQRTVALESWHGLLTRARQIEPDDHVRQAAIRITSELGLRALDAFQLAAAVVWCNSLPYGRAFISADRRLSAAASNLGFSTQSIER